MPSGNKKRNFILYKNCQYYTQTEMYKMKMNDVHSGQSTVIFWKIYIVWNVINTLETNTLPTKILRGSTHFPFSLRI